MFHWELKVRGKMHILHERTLNLQNIIHFHTKAPSSLGSLLRPQVRERACVLQIRGPLTQRIHFCETLKERPGLFLALTLPDGDSPKCILRT